MDGTRGTGVPLSVTKSRVTGLPGPQGPAAYPATVTATAAATVTATVTAAATVTATATATATVTATEGAAAEKCTQEESHMVSLERSFQQKGPAYSLWVRVQVSEGPPSNPIRSPKAAALWLSRSLSRALTCDPSHLLVLSHGACEAFSSPRGGPQRRGLSGRVSGGEALGGPVGQTLWTDGAGTHDRLCVPGTPGPSGPCSPGAAHHLVTGNQWLDLSVGHGFPEQGGVPSLGGAGGRDRTTARTCG